jgi:hypothetical protein
MVLGQLQGVLLVQQVNTSALLAPSGIVPHITRGILTLRKIVIMERVARERIDTTSVMVTTLGCMVAKLWLALPVQLGIIK